MPVRWRETLLAHARARRRAVRRGRTGAGADRPGQAHAAATWSWPMLDPRRIGRARPRRRPAAVGVRAARVRRSCRWRRRCPRRGVTTAELAERLGVSEDWIVSRTGIRARPVAAPTSGCRSSPPRPARARSSRAGVDAGRRRPRARGHPDPGRADAERRARWSPTRSAPTAPARSTSAPPAPASCPGCRSARRRSRPARAERVLLIGADIITRIVDRDDKRTAPLFGDGAGAVVLGPRGRRARGDRADRARRRRLGCAGDPHRPPDRKLRMDGPEVYRHAVARMGEATLAAVDGRRARRSRTSTCSSTTRPTAGSCARWRNGSSSRPSASSMSSRTSATPQRPRCRWPSARPSATAASRPARRCC